MVLCQGWNVIYVGLRNIKFVKSKWERGACIVLCPGWKGFLESVGACMYAFQGMSVVCCLRQSKFKNKPQVVVCELSWME